MCTDGGAFIKFKKQREALKLLFLILQSILQFLIEVSFVRQFFLFVWKF